MPHDDVHGPQTGAHTGSVSTSGTSWRQGASRRIWLHQPQGRNNSARTLCAKRLGSPTLVLPASPHASAPQ